MGKYDHTFKDVQKKRHEAKGKKETRSAFLTVLGGFVGFALTIGLFGGFIAFLIDPVTGVLLYAGAILIFLVYAGLSKLSEAKYQKDLDRIEKNKIEMFESIIDKEELEAKRKQLFADYYDAQEGLPFEKDLRIANEIIGIFEAETDSYKKEKIADYLENSIIPFTLILRQGTDDASTMKQSIDAFAEETIDFYRSLYKREDVIEVNTKVLQGLAALDGLYDPFADIIQVSEK